MRAAVIEVGTVAARKEGREAALAAAARGGVTIARCVFVTASGGSAVRFLKNALLVFRHETRSSDDNSEAGPVFLCRRRRSTALALGREFTDCSGLVCGGALCGPGG